MSVAGQGAGQDRNRPKLLSSPLTPEAFARLTFVSRETLDRLERYAALLIKWQKAINLVGGDSLGDLWRRHFLDSAQLYPLVPPQARTLLDLGSGAGFPGLVLAILGVPEVHLVESDSRKAAFLREAARVTGLTSPGQVTLHSRRVEQLEPWPVDVITARGCADLDKLLTYGEPFLQPETICLFPKGRTVNEELTRAEKNWTMTVQRRSSTTDASGVILQIGHIRREPGSSDET